MHRAFGAFCLLALAAGGAVSQQGELRGPYLGQKPPGVKPEVFAQGIVSTVAHEFSCCFSPDGKEFYFTRRHPELNQTVLMECLQRNGVWTEPDVAPFVEKQFSFEPWVTPDNKRLYFQSGKPIPGQPGPPMNVLYVDREGDGWGKPKNPGSPFNPVKAMHISSTSDGTVYTTDISQGPGSERIAVSRFVNGTYQELQRLGPPINGETQTMHPYVAPDESYMIYSARKGKEKASFELLISFRKPDGSWSQPKTIDLGMNAGMPFVSPDGKFLFFTAAEPGQSTGSGPGKSDIYWVSTKIIEQLRPSEQEP
jgi:hypothetical protein